MGCDIHPYLEVRLPTGEFSRVDSVVRALQRQAATGDPDAAQQLRSYELLGPWTFAAGRAYLYEEEELALEGEGEWVARRRHMQGLWYALPGRSVDDWSIGRTETYSIREGLLPFSRNRNYWLFGWLTGTVRNYGGANRVEGITAEPRGLPPDASPFVQAAYDDEGGDAHSASWLTAREVVEAPRMRVDGDLVDMMRPTLHAVTQAREQMARWGEAYGLDRVRLVFWFDN